MAEYEIGKEKLAVVSANMVQECIGLYFRMHMLNKFNTHRVSTFQKENRPSDEHTKDENEQSNSQPCILCMNHLLGYRWSKPEIQQMQITNFITS